MSHLSFQILDTDAKARRGLLTTAHGAVETPAFMPVGTVGTVKAMFPEAVADTGAQIILGNTYHLMLRPGAERVAALGGLHALTNWHGPILTDSGGFQVWSLAELRKLSEDGVTFCSHLDGSRHHLTPERSIEIQHLLDADISMQLDECPPHDLDKNDLAKSMALSLRWAERCKEAFRRRPGYGLFAINQGGIHPDLRAESAAGLTQIGFDGYAIGGLAVGESQEQMFATLDATAPLLPFDRPRYLMGVGKPEDLVGAVTRGMDMFDCVLPTRSGRTGQAFTRRGEVNLKNARHKDDPRPLDVECRCPCCTKYSRAYLHHLVKSREILAPMLLTWHNLHYFQDLMRGLREAIGNGELDAFEKAFKQARAEGDVPPLAHADGSQD